MFIPTRPSFLALTGLFILALSQGVSALDSEPGTAAQSISGNAAGFSLEDAAFKVQKLTGGEILSANPVRSKAGQLFYRFKVLIPGGRVKIIKIDPDDGEPAGNNK